MLSKTPPQTVIERSKRCDWKTFAALHPYGSYMLARISCWFHGSMPVPTLHYFCLNMQLLIFRVSLVNSLGPWRSSLNAECRRLNTVTTDHNYVTMENSSTSHLREERVATYRLCYPPESSPALLETTDRLLTRPLSETVTP